MAISFTPEQQKVIDLHNCNILVSAAAGSGKTAVLVERIIQMVCNEEKPVDIDRLLIVTFTNAAAAEMRERISLGISAKLEEKPESEHIQKQAALLHNAQITTIDSFCLFLLRNHFNEIGLDPAFRIADEGEVRLMQQEVLQELMEDGYREGGEAFCFCVEFFCPGGREKVLEQHILNLSRYAASFPFPEEWLQARKSDYQAQDVESISASDYGQYLLRYLGKMTAGCADRLERVRKLCEEPDGPYMYGELIERETEQIKALAGCKTLSDYERRLPSVSFGRLPSRKDDSVSHAKRELARKLRNEAKETLQKLVERFFATPLELAARQGYACLEPVGTLVDLVLDFDRRMGEKKQERKVIDFSDMEHFALQILLKREEDRVTPSAVALEYRQHFAEILIDEYQDSNLVQEYLLKAVSGEEEGKYNRFMVGDVKQSIYKFRLARPELFLEKYNTYRPEEGDSSEEGAGRKESGCPEEGTGRKESGCPEEGTGRKESGCPEEGTGRKESGCPEEGDSPESRVCRRIDLARNFRSRTQVVNTVNSVFARIMSRDIGGIEYDEKAALYPGAVYPEYVCGESKKQESTEREDSDRGTGSRGSCEYESELLLVEKPDRDGEENPRQLEARAIAARIRELMTGFQVTDKESGRLRPVRYSDIVLLLRTTSGWDEEFKQVLEEEGIPVYITSRTGYFSATEVQELLQFLRVLDNPVQDIPLFGVMKSVFGGFSEEEFAALRSGKKGCSLYEAVREYAFGEKGKEESPLRVKAAEFLEMLETYRDFTAYMPVRELLTRLVSDFDYLNYVTALPAGSKRRANVEMLFTKASDFEKTSYFGLFHFIRYMEQLEKYDVDYGEAELLDENADVVRIMSIHKSKGLEFPVTFVSGLGKRFNMQDANQSLIADMDLGIATDYMEPEKRVRNRTLRRCVLSIKLREDSLSEELRVLYVALTRAREKLILTATLENAREQWEVRKDSGMDSLSYLDYAEAGSFLDFLLPVLSGTDIRVVIRTKEELAADTFREQLSLHGRRAQLEQIGRPAETFPEATRENRENGPLEGFRENAGDEAPEASPENRENGPLEGFRENAGGEAPEATPENRRNGPLEGFRENAGGEAPEATPENRKNGPLEGFRENAGDEAPEATPENRENRAREDACRKLKQRLGAVYAYENLSGLYTKTTVSELKIAAMADKDEEAFHTFEEKEVQPYIPLFRREEEKVSGAVRGNAYHRVMEILDLDVVMAAAPGENRKKSLHDFLLGQVESHRLSREYFEAVREEKILNFLSSGLGQRMYRAHRKKGLYREQPFVMGISADRLGQGFPETETVLIQGIIDVFFVEEDGLVLLDYKTDSVRSMEELWNRYETQLDYYREALQKLMGQPVKERILYSFSLEKY